MSGCRWGPLIRAAVSDSRVVLSCVAQWRAYQEARQEVVGQMNEAELKLAEFSTAKASTWQEAEDKLQEHKVGLLLRQEAFVYVFHVSCSRKEMRC